MSKKILMKDIKNALKDIKDEPVKICYGENDSAIEVEFKRNLNLTDEMFLINMATMGSFIGNEYAPEYKHLAFVQAILSVMSNISLPVKDNQIDWHTLNEWDKKLDFIGGLYENSDICSYINYLDNVIQDKINYIKSKSKADDVLITLKELFDNLIELSNKYAEKLDGIDIKKTMQTFNTINNMDEGKFVTAIVDKAKEDKKESKDNITKLNEVKTK
jgi:hypothetical protein